MKGGLGNQLFCYAAARRLAAVNNADLVIDDLTGFRRDLTYRRTYALAPFALHGRLATSAERLEPFDRHRRWLRILMSRRKPFAQRRYLTQEALGFDPRLLQVTVTDCLHLDGLWQSEGYFKDVETLIRNELQLLKPPTDAYTQAVAREITEHESVAVHVRWFDTPLEKRTHNVSLAYYERAIGRIENLACCPTYFVFSDNPDATRSALRLPRGRSVFVSSNGGQARPYVDLWLMSACRHFIIANSTFSWWGAWLGAHVDKVVIAPQVRLEGKIAWGFSGLLPSEWFAV